MQRYFYCPEGYTALVLPQSDTVTAVDLSANTGFNGVVDLDQLSEQLNVTIILFCLKPRFPPTPSRKYIHKLLAIARCHIATYSVMSHLAIGEKGWKRHWDCSPTLGIGFC